MSNEDHRKALDFAIARLRLCVSHASTRSEETLATVSLAAAAAAACFLDVLEPIADAVADEIRAEVRRL